jgi:pilus assembly protein Flp/PilA
VAGTLRERLTGTKQFAAGCDKAKYVAPRQNAHNPREIVRKACVDIERELVFVNHRATLTDGLGITIRAIDGLIALSPWSTEMHSLSKNIVRFLKNEDGPTAVEYAVMLALIIVVCIVSITTLGKNANNTFSNVAAKAAPAGS